MAIECFDALLSFPFRFDLDSPRIIRLMPVRIGSIVHGGVVSTMLSPCCDQRMNDMFFGRQFTTAARSSQPSSATIK